MCNFISGYISHSGQIVWPGDLWSHCACEEIHKLGPKLRGLRPPWPLEWTENDHGESLTIRVGEVCARDEAWYKVKILRRWKTREEFLVWAIPIVAEGAGRLNLSDCTELTSLPDNLSVGGWLNLSGCTGLTSLPDNLSVGDWLDLSGCTGLTSLPDNLSVGGWLDLSGCTGLTSLPDNLSVGGWLNLRGCTGLKPVPKHLKAKAIWW